MTVGFMRRYDPGYADMKARLDAGAIGAPLLVHCAHRNPSVHSFFDSRDDHHRHRRPRDRHHALAARAGDRARDRADAAPVRSSARGACAIRSCSCSRPRGGQLVDVEAFVSAGYAYDIRCEVVGEDGTLELLPPATVAARAAHAESLAIPPGSASASGWRT